MDISSGIARAAPGKGMNDLHKKIDRYVYEICQVHENDKIDVVSIPVLFYESHYLLD